MFSLIIVNSKHILYDSQYINGTHHWFFNLTDYFLVQNNVQTLLHWAERVIQVYLQLKHTTKCDAWQCTTDVSFSSFYLSNKPFVYSVSDICRFTDCYIFYRLASVVFLWNVTPAQILQSSSERVQSKTGFSFHADTQRGMQYSPAKAEECKVDA